MTLTARQVLQQKADAAPSSLRRLRIMNGLELKEVAEQVGCSPGQICHLELKIQNGSLPLLKKLAAFYEVTLEQVTE